ncbi:MAG: lycopene cyclase family protein [Clostridia bacterium]|jgi:flavin-dependent dehydrogenase|nr:lycopene cyclase family protein [Clostridia bacterium]
MKKTVDILIVGSSISGLLIAKELSKNNKVLIIDKKKETDINVCYTGLKKYFEDTFFEKYISKEFKEAYVRFLDGNKKYLSADFVSLNEEDLIKDLLDEIRENGSEILFNTEYIGHKNENDNVLAEISGKIVKTKLIVDCTGSEYSKDSYYFNIYGGVYNKKILSYKDINFVEINEKRKPTIFFEYFPINDDQIVLYVFDFSKEKINPIEYKELEKEYITKANIGITQVDKLKEVYGSIPMGKMKTSKEDNVFIYGNAANISPSATGFSLINMVKTYEGVTKFLQSRIEENKFDKKSLSYKYESRFLMNQEFQYAAAKVNLKASPDEIIQLFEAFTDENELFIKFCTSDLNKGEIFKIIFIMFKKVGFLKIFRILGKESFSVINSLIKIIIS